MFEQPPNRERRCEIVVKYYCDRCGKETKNLEQISVPSEKKRNSFLPKLFQVCPECEKEYDDIINKLTDIRFVLFDGFMRKEDEGE